MNLDFPKYSFKLQYFDEQSELIRFYVLLFYTENSEIEIFDVKNRRIFLRKTPLHNIRMSDLYIGSKLQINGRQYEITDYSDEFTRSAFTQKMQHTFAMIKPNFSQHLGDVLDSIYSSGLLVAQLQFGYITKDTAAALFQCHQNDVSFESLVRSITVGPIVALDIVGDNSISKWRQLMGERYGDDFTYGSDSPSSASRELGLIFGQRSIHLKAQMDGTTTLCIIKPHAMKEGVSGKIIKQIVSNGFEIVGAIMVTLDVQSASEFYEVYRGVVDNYFDMSRDLASGPVLALELYKENAVNAFREVCGPRDVAIAKAIRPQSIRAIYGVNNIQNAVHCTDLECESQIECEFFFTLLGK